jgi:hypothetical protein
MISLLEAYGCKFISDDLMAFNKAVNYTLLENLSLKQGNNFGYFPIDFLFKSNRLSKIIVR